MSLNDMFRMHLHEQQYSISCGQWNRKRGKYLGVGERRVGWVDERRIGRPNRNKNEYMSVRFEGI
jgi:hypothetical protein